MEIRFYDVKIKCGLLTLIFIYVFSSPIFSEQIDDANVSTSEIPNDGTIQQLTEGYYLVVGVFSNLENVKKYTEQLKGKGFQTSYAYSNNKNRYYVYLAHSDSIKGVQPFYDQIKLKANFLDVWILNVKNHSEKKVISKVQPDSTRLGTLVADRSETSDKKHDHHNHHHHRQSYSHRDLSATHHSYKVFINVHDGNSNQISTIVKVINGEKGMTLANLNSHQEGVINCPKVNSQRVQLVCDVFGYHKTSLDIYLDDPLTPSTKDNVKLTEDKIIIEMPLEKYKKGDIMVMYNVFFHPNTNVMRIISNYELQKLLSMMTENPKLKIKIHGHTNGNSFGEITKIKDSCYNFFNPKDTEGIKGSSQKLSQLRSEAIKMYLIRNGIDENRIQVKGWGGKKMLYKEDSPKYEYNVRVEVEVLDN